GLGRPNHRTSHAPSDLTTRSYLSHPCGGLPPEARTARVACPAGLEPATTGLEGRCSIQLSYGHADCIAHSPARVPSWLRCQASCRAARPRATTRHRCLPDPPHGGAHHTEPAVEASIWVYPRHSMPHPPRQPIPAHTRAPIPAPADGAGESREVEWQLTAPDLGAVRRWLERHTFPEPVRIEPLPPQQLHDRYLDTEDWRVFRAGFALRLRDNEGHVDATLKGLHSAREDVADRREITEPLPAGKVKALARATGPVGGRVRDVAGIKPLRTRFDVRTPRQRFAVRSRDTASVLGEIALDEARFSRGDRHRRPMILTRVELEATGPDTTPLERLADRLRTECELHPASENKFAVGLRSASLEPPRTGRPDPGSEASGAVMAPSTRAGAFAAAALQRLLQDWQAHEPAARLGEGPEPLHKLRVTARRMDTVLTLFRACLPAGLRRSRPTLKRLRD